MKKMTELGLELEFDAERSAADNFYRQVFGRWPETEYSWSDTGMLEKIIESSEYADSIKQFFGLDVERKEPFSQLGYDDVMNGLRELREKHALEIVAIYEYGADQSEQAFRRLLSDYLGLKIEIAMCMNGSSLAGHFRDYCAQLKGPTPKQMPIDALGVSVRAQ